MVPVSIALALVEMLRPLDWRFSSDAVEGTRFLHGGPLVPLLSSSESMFSRAEFVDTLFMTAKVRSGDVLGTLFTFRDNKFIAIFSGTLDCMFRCCTEFC